MQHPLFRASEILDMAIQIEHAGLRFYEVCVQAALGKQTEEVFEYLIDQERKHIQVFSRMKEGLEDYPLPETYPGEMRNYIDSFIKDRVFYEPAKASRQAGEIEDPLEAIEWAIAFEKRSILFYSGIKQVVRSSEMKVIDQVIASEHSHIRRLLELRRELENR
ncbi:MAG: ferritin family protein [Desulforhabdus sp.]|jgi:rubrerythrin|nr:ferritin family protein [Desulforhabdus sp.]